MTNCFWYASLSFVENTPVRSGCFITHLKHKIIDIIRIVGKDCEIVQLPTRMRGKRLKRILVVLLFIVVLGGATFFLWRNSPFSFPSKKPSNVVLIGIDTLRADHVSCYGYKKTSTPRLDEAARNGVRFSHVVSQAPWTLPSFSTVFTSLHPSRHGAQINRKLRDLSKHAPSKLEDVTTLTKLLGDDGLITHAFVSNPFTGYGIDRDFDEFEFYWNGAHEITDEGISLVRANKQTPFFLYLHYNDPHEHNKMVPQPYTKQFTPETLLSQLNGTDPKKPDFGLQMYDAQISFCDSQIGRFFDELKNLGLWDSTLIVILSDHGEEFQEHKDEHKQHGFDPRGIYGTGHGQSLYGELLDVILIMAGGAVPTGRVIDGDARLIDVMPTILDLMNIKTDITMEGHSLKKAFESGVVEKFPSFSEAIAYGYEKKAVQYNGWKYIISSYNSFEELYNIAQDPFEKFNLIHQEKMMAQSLRKKLDAFIQAGNEDYYQQKGEGEIDEHTKKRLQDLGYLN